VLHGLAMEYTLSNNTITIIYSHLRNRPQEIMGVSLKIVRADFNTNRIVMGFHESNWHKGTDKMMKIVSLRTIQLRVQKEKDFTQIPFFVGYFMNVGS
jgi:hypothetical protein